MDDDEIRRRLTGVFQDIFDDDRIALTRETTSVDIEDWDSLANIRLIIAAEKEFGVTFKLPEIKALENVGGMLDLIASKLA